MAKKEVVIFNLCEKIFRDNCTVYKASSERFEDVEASFAGEMQSVHQDLVSIWKDLTNSISRLQNK